MSNYNKESTESYTYKNNAKTVTLTKESVGVSLGTLNSDLKFNNDLKPVTLDKSILRVGTDKDRGYVSFAIERFEKAVDDENYTKVSDKEMGRYAGLTLTPAMVKSLLRELSDMGFRL